MNKPVVTRFAPSPTGFLHVGHAFSALFAQQAARAAAGRYLVRLEDIDPVRCRPDLADAILQDLAWLGLDSDGPVRRQSQHLADYATALARLRDDGLLYPCFCTRKDIQAEIQRAGHAPQGPDGPLYPGLCRNLPATERADRIAAGQPHAWRLDMAAALRRLPPQGLSFVEAGQRQKADPSRFGDVVLGRKDVPAAYHLAVVLDDAVQQITLVTRGVDLLPAAHLHRLLQHLFALPEPAYHHHPLMQDDSGRRLAKRDGAPSLRAMRAAGVAPADLLAQLRASPGWTSAVPAATLPRHV